MRKTLLIGGLPAAELTLEYLSASATETRHTCYSRFAVVETMLRSSTSTHVIGKVKEKANGGHSASSWNQIVRG